MKTTPYTATARRNAKKLLAAIQNKSIQIWKDGDGFQVMTFVNPGYSYGSVRFESEQSAFRHILTRASNTGFDTQRFSAVADRYFRRFLAI